MVYSEISRKTCVRQSVVGSFNVKLWTAVAIPLNDESF
jgi:hypothetical protein